jgi:hemerythrin-like domain-containing protein
MICITDGLIVEHTVLRNVFSHLEKMLPNLEKTETVQALAHMVEDLLSQHGEAEDQLLYATLNHTLAEIGQLEQMQQEHKELDNRLAKVFSAADAEVARRELKAVIGFSRRHFDHEEKVVFPIARHHVSEAALKSIGACRYSATA